MNVDNNEMETAEIFRRNFTAHWGETFSPLIGRRTFHNSLGGEFFKYVGGEVFKYVGGRRFQVRWGEEFFKYVGITKCGGVL